MGNEATAVTTGPSTRPASWPLLADTSRSSSYDNATDPAFPNDDGPLLADGRRFSFGTFGFPPLDAEVVEYAEPTDTTPGRLSWTAKQEDAPDEKLDVRHCWLLEDLPGGRVRIQRLTA